MVEIKELPYDIIKVKDNEYEALKLTEKEVQQILQDHELRKIIVDLADIWDGVESERYGKQLLEILNDLGIKDIPEFYSKENMDRFLKELDQDKQDHEDAKKCKQYKKLWKLEEDLRNKYQIEMLKNSHIVKKLKAKLKECKENAGGMEFGLVLEKILEGKI